METILEKAYSAQEFKKVSYELIDMLTTHLENCQNQTITEVIPYQKPSESLAFWTDHIANPNTDPLKLFKIVLEKSTHLHHPKSSGGTASAIGCFDRFFYRIYQ
jgi:L-2,4-diaminobutyrate decarboxylase